MGKRRGADERRGPMRGLAEEAREEFRRAEQADTGGQEHASRADREGASAPRPHEAGAGDRARAAPERSGAEGRRVPRGDGGGGAARGATPPGRGEPEER